MMTKIKAKELTTGQTFCLHARLNAKTFTIGDKPDHIHTIEPKDGGPTENHGRLLLIGRNCRQMIIDPETEVILIS